MGSDNSKEASPPEVVLNTSKDESNTLTEEDEPAQCDFNNMPDPDPSRKLEALYRIIGAAKGTMTQPLINYIKK